MPYPSTNHDLEIPKSADRIIEQISPSHKLEIYVLEQINNTCNHNYELLTTSLTRRWKGFWNEKICLLWLKGQNRGWPDIVKWFEEQGFKKNQKALYSLWARTSTEINAMKKAIEQYVALCELSGDLEVEHLDPWDTISASMEACGAKESWTPDKVKYAWHHGASTLLKYS